MIIKNKKAVDVTGVSIFILLNLVFFTGMLIFISNVGSQDSMFEKIEARKIAVAIDEMKTGTEISLDISALLERAEKNNFAGEIFSFDYDKGLLNVKVSKNGGNSFTFFTQLAEGSVSLNKNDKLLVIKN